ncbi:unnamed protein product [Calypogeia fissa]
MTQLVDHSPAAGQECIVNDNKYAGSSARSFACSKTEALRGLDRGFWKRLLTYNPGAQAYKALVILKTKYNIKTALWRHTETLDDPD